MSFGHNCQQQHCRQEPYHDILSDEGADDVAGNLLLPRSDGRRQPINLLINLLASTQRGYMRTLLQYLSACCLLAISLASQLCKLRFDNEQALEVTWKLITSYSTRGFSHLTSRCHGYRLTTRRHRRWCQCGLAQWTSCRPSVKIACQCLHVTR